MKTAPQTARAAQLRFAVIFLAAFAILMGAFEASRGSAFERFVVETLILRPTAFLINTATPLEHVRLVGRALVSPDGSALRVTRGCEGIEMFLLLVAALVAFPASARQRLSGLLWGGLLAYALSVSRLMTLYYVLRHSPALWDALHGLILPLAPVILLALYFVRWTGTTTRPMLARA
jgi:exosortase/archaeosortase family protein